MIISMNKVFDKIQTKIDLSKLCSCQMMSLGGFIEEVTGTQKELVLGYLYIESLLQGILFSHSNEEYWTYLKAIENRKVTMIYHGTYEVQFRMMLKMPEYAPTYDQRKLYESISNNAEDWFSLWLQMYENLFGAEAVRRLKFGVRNDPDIHRLVDEYKFLIEPFNTTFGHRR